jgi:hypothetical protein
MANSLPTVWVDRIFSHLSAMYGSKFAQMWQGTNLPDVKAMWAEKLGGFGDKPEAIKQALSSFDEEPWPPTLPDFIQACRIAAKRIQPELAALPAPMTADHAAKLIAEIHAKAPVRKTETYDTKGWAKKIRSGYLAGNHMLPIQIAMASEALGESWSDGKCLPRKEVA